MNFLNFPKNKLERNNLRIASFSNVLMCCRNRFINYTKKFDHYDFQKKHTLREYLTYDLDITELKLLKQKHISNRKTSSTHHYYKVSMVVAFLCNVSMHFNYCVPWNTWNICCICMCSESFHSRYTQCIFFTTGPSRLVAIVMCYFHVWINYL